MHDADWAIMFIAVIGIALTLYVFTSLYVLIKQDTAKKIEESRESSLERAKSERFLFTMNQRWYITRRICEMKSEISSIDRHLKIADPKERMRLYRKRNQIAKDLLLFREWLRRIDDYIETGNTPEWHK